MKSSSKLLGAALALLTVGGTVGASVVNNQQLTLADTASHLVKLETKDEIYYISASDIDYIYAPVDENGTHHVEVASNNPISGEQTKLIEATVTKQVLADFVAEANKYRK